MPSNLPTLSESTWIGAFVGVVGAVGSVIGAAYIFAPQPVIPLAVGAGFGWALVVALFVVNGLHRARLKAMESELADARRQAENWSSTAADASAASRAVAELFRPNTPAPTPRTTRNTRKRS